MRDAESPMAERWLRAPAGSRQTMRYYQLGLSLLDAAPTHNATGDDSNRARSSCFLQGDVGAALALLAALYAIKPGWDRRLLVSGRRVTALAM